MKKRKILLAAGLGVILLFGLAASDKEPEFETLLPQGTLSMSSPFDPLYSVNTDPALSSQALYESIHLDDFTAVSATSGKGQKIAVIDSGLDVGHPDFSGEQKIGRYLDLTKEGIITTKAASHHKTQVSSGGKIYQIGDIPNQQSQYYLGVLDINKLLGNFKGTYGLLITAQGQDGYDTLYVDANQNFDFTDEVPIKVFSAAGDYLSLTIDGKRINLLMTEMDKSGESLKLSGDFLGHGTFIAGIIGADGEKYRGLAPECQLLIYKIFDQKGASSQLVLANAIENALADGADVINLSLSLPAKEQVEPLLLAAINKAQKAKVPIVAAAGNYGSALGTLAFPANQQGVISAGCYIVPELQRLEIDVYLEEGYIPAYSARGPAQHQSGPTVVATGGINASVPLWFGEQYMYDEGTSAAAAVTAAAISHILEYARQNEMVIDQDMLENILALSAKDLHQPITDQGFGLLDMSKTAAVIEALPQKRQGTITLLMDQCQNLFQKNTSPAAPTIVLTNNDSESHDIQWQSNNQSIDAAKMVLAPKSTKTFSVSFNDTTNHQQQWGILAGTIDDDLKPSLFVPIMSIRPYSSDQFTNQPLLLSDNIPQGQSRHYYIEVAPQTKTLTTTLALNTQEPQNQYEHQIIMGRCKLKLFDPNGKLAQETPYFGASYGNMQKAAQSITVDKPEAGIWQISVISSGQLSVYNHFNSETTLKIEAQQ